MQYLYSTHYYKELTLRVQPFQFRSQTPLQKGMPAEGTILQPVPDKLWEGAVVSALSVGKTINSLFVLPMVTLPASDRYFIYGLHSARPEVNLTHHRDEGYSPPR